MANKEKGKNASFIVCENSKNNNNYGLSQNNKSNNKSFITQQKSLPKIIKNVHFRNVEYSQNSLKKSGSMNTITPMRNTKYQSILSNFNKVDVLNKGNTIEDLKKKLIQQSHKNSLSDSLYFNKTNNSSINNNMNKSLSLPPCVNSSYRNKFFIPKGLRSNSNFHFSKFFLKSQSQFMTAKKIYNHYIKFAEKHKLKPINYFKTNGSPKRISEIKTIYSENENQKFNNRLIEIKKNDGIAYKDDFNIFEYQSTLLKILSNKVSDKGINELQKKFICFNERNLGYIGPKGRFTNMAEKIKYNIPAYLYEKIRKMDKAIVQKRTNYYHRIQQNLINKLKKNSKIKKLRIKREGLSKSKEINNSF